MKKHYTQLFFLSLAFLLFAGRSQGLAQCIGGGTPGITAYDTTIRFPSGTTNKQIKFPKFDAQTGMVTCVRMIVTMTAIIDTTSFENLLSSPYNVTRSYSRNDAMTGPGLTPSLSNNFSGTRTFPLGANDGVPNAGADFYSSAKDTIMRQQMTRTLTDSASVSSFYGTDSVVYDYNINVVTNVSGSGDIASYMRTSTLVNFRFEYCTCPLAALPVGLKNFTATRQGTSSALLRWEAEAGNDRYFYVVETSTDGRRFNKATTLNKQSDGSSVYQYGHALSRSQGGRIYYRIRQQWLDGYYRYSEVRWLDFASTSLSAVSLYPNPSTGAVGVKFVAARAGTYKIEISNAGGQVVTRNEVQVAETDLKRLDALQKGVYYIKITEVATGIHTVQQLVVH